MEVEKCESCGEYHDFRRRVCPNTGRCTECGCVSQNPNESPDNFAEMCVYKCGNCDGGVYDLDSEECELCGGEGWHDACETCNDHEMGCHYEMTVLKKEEDVIYNKYQHNKKK